jgi:hypothetical protein
LGSILSASRAARMQCFSRGDLIDSCLRDQKRARSIRVNRKETKCLARRSLQIDPLMLLRNRLEDGTVSAEVLQIQSRGLPGHIEGLRSSLLRLQPLDIRIVRR